MCVRLRSSRVVVLSSAVLAMLFAAACAARRAPAARFDDLDRSSLVRGHACDRSDQDTTHYLHVPLYRACAVTVAARRVANDMRPEYWPTGRDRSCFTALVEVVVDTLGRPELRSTRLVRVSDPGYAAAVLAIVPGMRFVPARLGERPVRQIFELREVLLIRRGRGLEGSGGQRVQTSGTRTPRGVSSTQSASMPSEAPTGAELPSLQSLGGVC
jgi:hypothetical protein